MYSPSAFSITDADVIRRFLRANSFGIVVSRDAERLHDTHTPMLISDDLKTVTGHIARANPQWKTWREDPEVKLLFHGPHAYVSPRFYTSDFNVPTWNYSAVSIDGRIEILDDPDRCAACIDSLVAFYEGPDGWRRDPGDERYARLLDAVVCFSVEVRHLDAKFKLNQNKSPDDRRSVISHLLSSASPMDRGTGGLMEEIAGDV